jgi:hypothetical protein
MIINNRIEKHLFIFSTLKSYRNKKQVSKMMLRNIAAFRETITSLSADQAIHTL